MRRFLLLLLVATLCISSNITSLAASRQQSTVATPSGTASTQADKSDKGKPDVKVWVNTNSGVYHCPDSQWYGKTKEGKYMTQAEAQKAGHRPAYHKVCQ